MSLLYQKYRQNHWPVWSKQDPKLDHLVLDCQIAIAPTQQQVPSRWYLGLVKVPRPSVMDSFLDLSVPCAYYTRCTCCTVALNQWNVPVFFQGPGCVFITDSWNSPELLVLILDHIWASAWIPIAPSLPILVLGNLWGGGGGGGGGGKWGPNLFPDTSEVNNLIFRDTHNMPALLWE